MRLLDLEPKFVLWRPENWPNADGQRIIKIVPTLSEANGVCFLCPKCFQKKNSSIGVHSVECWAPEVPLPPTGPYPEPGRWRLQGTGLDDLTLVAGSSSVLITEGCKAHFYIRAGAIIDA